MKLQIALILSAFLTLSGAAADPQCSADVNASLQGNSDEEFKIVCPVLVAISDRELGVTTDTTDPLDAVTQCADTSCTTFIKDMLDMLPDCVDNTGVNYKAVYTTMFNLCQNLVSGSITSKGFEESFTDVVKSITEAKSGETQREEAGDSDASTTTPPTPMPSSTPPDAMNSSTTAAPKESSTTARSEKSITTAPATMTSGAMMLPFGVTAVATATVVVALMI